MFILRRSLLVRSRHVYQLRAVYLNEHYFVLSLSTSAGTYVKEFVHGDFGANYQLSPHSTVSILIFEAKSI